jgi:hypothetical protein
MFDFVALSTLRAVLVKAIAGESSDLPRLLSFTPPTTLPSLVVAPRGMRGLGPLQTAEKLKSVTRYRDELSPWCSCPTGRRVFIPISRLVGIYSSNAQL